MLYKTKIISILAYEAVVGDTLIISQPEDSSLRHEFSITAIKKIIANNQYLMIFLAQDSLGKITKKHIFYELDKIEVKRLIEEEERHDIW